MNCPSCGVDVSRGTAICPACDEILDASVFEEPAAAESFEEKTGAMATPFAAEVEPPPRPTRQPEPPPLRRPATPVAAPALGLRGDPRKAAAAQPPEEAPATKRGRRRRPARPSVSADEVLTDGWAAYRSLPLFEQVSILCLLLGSIAMLFPWRTTEAAGEEIGIFAAALGLLPLTLGGLAVWVRNSSDLHGFRADQLALIQLLAGLLLVGYCALFFYQTLESGIYRSALGQLNLHTSTPEFGVIACGLASLGLAAAGGWGFLEERGLES